MVMMEEKNKMRSIGNDHVCISLFFVVLPIDNNNTILIEYYTVESPWCVYIRYHRIFCLFLLIF